MKGLNAECCTSSGGCDCGDCREYEIGNGFLISESVDQTEAVEGSFFVGRKDDG